MKNNKETKRKHKEFVSRFEPPLYVPAFTTVKDFHYNRKGNYKRSTQDRSTELPPIQPLHKRCLNTKKVTSNKVIKNTTNFSLTTPYRMGMNFWLKK